MTDLNDANAEVRTAYQDAIETLTDGVMEELDEIEDADLDRLLHETADAAHVVTHHPHLALAASENAPRIEDVPEADKNSLAYRAVKQDLREAVHERRD